MRGHYIVVVVVGAKVDRRNTLRLDDGIQKVRPGYGYCIPERGQAAIQGMYVRS